MANQPITNISVGMVISGAGVITREVYGLGNNNNVYLWNTTSEQWDLYT